MYFPLCLRPLFVVGLMLGTRFLCRYLQIMIQVLTRLTSLGLCYGTCQGELCISEPQYPRYLEVIILIDIIQKRVVKGKTTDTNIQIRVIRVDDPRYSTLLLERYGKSQFHVYYMIYFSPTGYNVHNRTILLVCTL